MADDVPEYLPFSNLPSASMLATCSRAPTSAVKRSRSTDDNPRPRQRTKHDTQAITTIGVSGNSSVVNFGGDHITHINDVLGADTYAVLESIEERLKVVHDIALDDRVGGWLAAPDVSKNLNAALRSLQTGTCVWFLDSPTFAEWKRKPNVVLCIYGAPGCGKTVLCSAIIEAVKRSCATPLLGWAYFFFDSRNANQGLLLYENFLRSVLSQLCCRCGGIPEAVKALYQSHSNGREQPSVRALEEALRTVMAAFDDVYIMVDSLDECGDKIELLKWIQTVASWSSAKCHIVATTRPEPDITNRLELVRNIHTIHLQGSSLHRDISNYLDRRLSLIGRWTEPIRILIKTTLLGGADGMFRWVAMQMDSLESCMNTKEIREKLETLPTDLEETYEQILTKSPRRRELLHMLHWLAFSARELRLNEIAEVPSVDFDAAGGPCYDPGLKYANPSIALTVCSGLVTEMDGIVKLAHFSVKEYLISDRIKTGMAAQFAMSERLSHSVIAQTCVAYLMIFDKPQCILIPVTATGRFPLHLYAAEYTSSHLSLTHTTTCPALQSLLLKFFTPARRLSSALVHWLRMYEPDTPWPKVDARLQKAAHKVARPLYYASWLGLKHVAERLLESGDNIDLVGGEFGTALQAATERGHREIVTMLLEHGADANIYGGYYGTALQAAAYKGHTDIAITLIECGAGVDVLGGRHSTALQAAATQGHTETGKMLLERGADVNILVWPWGYALLTAVEHRHTECSKMLLVHGADVNLRGGQFGTVLQAAAYEGSTETVKLLLERGADVDLQGGVYGTALQAAAHEGYIETTKLLLEYGADVDRHGGAFGTALQAAAHEGSIETVKLLLEHGADVNLQGGDCGTALQAAAYEGSIKTVKLLLERGADVNIQGGEYGNALQAATQMGHGDIQTLLLQHGAAMETRASSTSSEPSGDSESPMDLTSAS